jgi:hypothetical protein
MTEPTPDLYSGTMPAEERRAPTEDAVCAVGVSDAPKVRGVIVASLTHSVVRR